MWLKKDLPDGRQVQRIFIPKGFDWVKTISPMLSKAGEGPVMWWPAVQFSDRRPAAPSRSTRLHRLICAQVPGDALRLPRVW